MERRAWPFPATWAGPDCRSSAIPKPLPPVDYLIMESTYGGRKHPQENEAIGQAGIGGQGDHRTGRTPDCAGVRGGPHPATGPAAAPADERAQLPAVPIFVDSPLAVNVTEVFRAHPECFDAETYKYLQNGEDPFGFSRLTYIRDAAESKKLNDLRGPVHRDFGLGHVRSRTHPAPSAAQCRRSAKHRAADGISGGEHAGPQAEGGHEERAHLRHSRTKYAPESKAWTS